MKQLLTERISLGEHLACYGNFKMSDPVCNRFCVLNLRCAIERDQSDQMEILEEMIYSEGVMVRYH